MKSKYFSDDRIHSYNLIPFDSHGLIFRENHLGSLLKLKSKAPVPKSLTQSEVGVGGLLF